MSGLSVCATCLVPSLGVQVTLLVSSPQGLVTRRALLRFAALFDYGAPEVRCDLASPISRLAQLLDMNPAEYTPVAGAEVPVPV